MAVRIGFVGAGGIANRHLDRLGKIKDAKPVAVVDINTEHAEKTAEQYGITVYSDVDKMMDKESLDAVYVCLPPFAHQNAEIAIARRGLAMFVEKPLSNNLKEAEKIALAVEEAGIITAVGYNVRYLESTQRLKKMLEAKGASQPAMLYGRYLGSFPGVAWWRKLEMSGGQLVEQGTHIVDAARYLNGEITSVHAVAALREMDKFFDGVTIPDVMALTVTFANGSIGYLATTSIGVKFDVGIEIYARDTNYSLTMDKLTVNDAANSMSTTFTDVNDCYMNSYLDEDIAFVKAVKSKKAADINSIHSNYADALKTLRVTLAANQSMKSGKSVKIG